MPRARVAIAAAIATTCAAAAAACTLSDEYSSKYGEDSGADFAAGDASPGPGSDATVLPGAEAGSTSDAAVEAAADAADATDAADAFFDPCAADAAPDAGPGLYGDYCYGVPIIVTPMQDATVGESVPVTVLAPSCIKTMLVYLDSVSLTGDAAIQGCRYTTTLNLTDSRQYKLNAHAWNRTDDAHASDQVYFTVDAGDP